MLRAGLPGFLIIGAMKCGTTALHGLLAAHPDLCMSEPKELNFFLGPERAPEDAGWSVGNWHRGIDWYVRRWPAGGGLRGESSPGYTSPTHADVAARRVAEVLPDARLVYLVRDPVERAVSQYRHHVRDGDETRSMATALLDPASQYLSRSRYAERLEPYRAYLDAGRLLVVDQQDLRLSPGSTLAQVHEFLEVPAAPEPGGLRTRDAAGGLTEDVDDALRHRLEDELRDDAARLRRLTGLALEHWSV